MARDGAMTYTEQMARDRAMTNLRKWLEIEQ